MSFSTLYRYGVAGLVALAVLGLAVWYGVAQKKVAHLREQARANHVDFDVSMQTDRFPSAWKTKHDRAWLDKLRAVYEKNNLLKVDPDPTPRIPKVIHQIWLGSPVPEKFKEFQESWQKLHPDWTYKLWTDEDVKHMKLYNRVLYDASINYGEKSDILRYEILYREGGVYADFDYECLKPLDLFNHCYDFYIGIQPLDTYKVQLGIGLIGSIPGHPLLKKTIEGIRRNATVQIVFRTGPGHFTNIFHAYAGTGKTRDVAMPASYFYPRGYEQLQSLRREWQKPESYAVHHWAGSWLDASAFVKNRTSGKIK